MFPACRRPACCFGEHLLSLNFPTNRNEGLGGGEFGFTSTIAEPLRCGGGVPRCLCVIQADFALQNMGCFPNIVVVKPPKSSNCSIGVLEP